MTPSKPLTTQERATKIWQIISGVEHYNEGYGGGPKELYENAKKEVVAIIEEAQAEEKQKWIEILNEQAKFHRAEGSRAAQEKAMKWISDYTQCESKACGHYETSDCIYSFIKEMKP